MYEGFDTTYQSKSLSLLMPRSSLRETIIAKNQSSEPANATTEFEGNNNGKEPENQFS